MKGLIDIDIGGIDQLGIHGIIALRGIDDILPADLVIIAVIVVRLYIAPLYARLQLCFV